MKKSGMIQDKIRGCLVGGAAGDALGYPVEFLLAEQIFDRYGSGGIQAYSLDLCTGKAIVSDDTQMTLFTANGLLSMHRSKEHGISGDLRHNVLYAYLGWLHTQQYSYSPESRIPDDRRGFASHLLQDVPQLYVPRAPGITCLTALGHRLQQLDNREEITDYIADPINNSKGCGGVMRVAPLGLAVNGWGIKQLGWEGAQLAAITHSHPLGYIPAAFLTNLIHRLVYGPQDIGLKETILITREHIAALFLHDAYTPDFCRIIDRALELSENHAPDIDNIHLLGGGWVAEEALAISLYCTLKYRNDFSKAIIAAVNHNGDSDSTGAITGNIVGALVGYSGIASHWTKDLELHNLIIEIADALFEIS